MDKASLIEATQFCNSHNIDITFVEQLEEFGLIEITELEQRIYFSEEYLPEVEKMVRLYADLGINIEGLDAIRHLLVTIESMQFEINQLKAQLQVFAG